MANEYAPKLFLRQAQNELLREYFSARGNLTGLDWDNIEETSIEPVYEAWQALTEQVQEEIERDFRDIHELATEDGTRTLVEEGHFHGIDLVVELDDRDGFLNKVFWVFLRHPRIFEVAAILDRADHLNQRSWRKRKDMPKKTPDASENALGELAGTVSSYFREKQGRGRHCHVDPYLRGGRYHYFFVYPQDYTDTFIGYTDDGSFERRPQNPAFEVIYVYDPLDGTLDLYVQGDKNIKRDLQELFARTILHEDIGEENSKSTPYELNGLKRRDFAFPTDPADRITEVRVKELRLSIIGSPRQNITFKVDPKGPKEEIYDLIDRALYARQLPTSMLNVSSAVIQMRFGNTGGNGRDTRTVTFRVSFPDSCNLKDKPEHMVAKRYLKKWGIERA